MMQRHILVSVIAALLLLVSGLVMSGTFQQAEHGGVDNSYPDRGGSWYYDGVTGVSRSHIDPAYASVPRGTCYHCHEYLSVLTPLYWPQTFTPYGTQEERVNFCGNCHTDTDPDANGINGDTPADYSFQGPTKFKQSQHYKRQLRWPGGQYGSSYPARAADKAGICTNCHNPHGQSYSSSFASVPASWTVVNEPTPTKSAADIPYPKQLVELTDVNNTPNAMADWGITKDLGTGRKSVTGWPNVGGRDPDDAEDLCFTCHDGDPVQNKDVSSYNTYRKFGVAPAGVSGTSIKEAIQQTYHHPVKDSDQVTIQTGHSGDPFFAGSTASVVYKVECTTCHNPHLASGHWNDFYTDPTATPLVLPNASPNWPNPAPTGYVAGELWGDEPEEKMNGLMQRMFTQKGVGGCGTWAFNVARGYLGLTPPCDQPAIYVPPIGGADTVEGRQPDGDHLPDMPTFCLDCHQNQVGNHRPIYWGASFPTAASISGQPQGYEPHGFDPANSSAFVCPAGCTSTACAMGGITSGELAGEPRGLGYETFTRAPYNIQDRLAGANFVLACTDCHEPHGSSRRSLFRHTINGSDMGDQSHNTICNACHWYYGGEMTYGACGTGGMKACAWGGCHNSTDCNGSNPDNYCWSLHRIRKNHLGNTRVVYKPQNTDFAYTCADNGPGVIGLWHFDDNNATSGVTRANYQDSSNNGVDLARGHKGTGSYDGPADGGATQPWSGSSCTVTGCANLFSSGGKFGYTGDKSLNLVGRDGFAFSRSARCFNFRTPNPEVLDSPDPNSASTNFTIEAWVKFNPTATGKDQYAVTGRTSFGYHPGGRVVLENNHCSGLAAPPADCVLNGSNFYPAYIMSVYDKTVAGLNGTANITDASQALDSRAAYSSVPVPINVWTLITVTMDANRSPNPLRIYMNGKDVTSSAPRTAVDNWSMPPVGWAQNSDKHPYPLMDPAYCTTCTWFQTYQNYSMGWAMGVQSNVGTSDMTFGNTCPSSGGVFSLGPTCGYPKPMEGLIDDIRLANTTLTPEQVCARYVSGASGVPAPKTIEAGIAISNCP